ncbi:MAG: hypothetical protein ACYC6Y_07555 [Thermoguttaceae bacterium]
MSANTAAAKRGNLAWLAFLLRNGFLPAILGAVAVVSVAPINFAAFGLWLVLLASCARIQLRQQCRTLAVAAVMIQVAVIVAIVTGAHLAPGKTTERFLDRTITLPGSRMTLEELAGDPNAPRPERRPFWVGISVPDDEKIQVIVFPERTISLRQFVSAVESQSTLRHRFAHCGNGWTILWGGDCSSGLHLRRPRESPY